MSGHRLADARERLAADGADALLVGPGADLAHLTGHHALPLERLTMLVVPARAPATLVVPRLEEPLARDGLARAGTPFDEVAIVAWEETDDPLDVIARALERVLAHPSERALGGAHGRVLVGAAVWSSFTLGLQARLPGVQLAPAGTALAGLRVVKEAEEVARLRAAAEAIDVVHAAVPGLLRVGRSEREVARDLAGLILAGHDRVNFVIVASGPNGASPHHDPGPRRLEAGDAVVVDIGGTLDGYCSDVTRDYVIGHPPDGYLEAHAALEDAQARASAAVAPGTTAQDIDRIARDVLTEAGYGDRFVHRTGHGIGREEHEPPWIVAGDRTVLAPGMAFSVEPGIYLPGRFGMRIEDIVVVAPDGVDVLNHRPRAALVVSDL